MVVINLSPGDFRLGGRLDGYSFLLQVNGIGVEDR